MSDTLTTIARPPCSSRSLREPGRTKGPGSFALSAFTLIELLMVLAIIATMSALAVPRIMESEARWRVEGAARRIEADLEQARSTAIASSSSVEIAFGSTGYTITPSDGSAATAVRLDNRPYLVAISSASFGGSRKISFDGRGAGSANGTVEVSGGGYACSVKVDATTGAAKASEIGAKSGGARGDAEAVTR